MIEFVGCKKLPSSKDVTEIYTQDRTVDLHNASEFKKYTYDVHERTLLLKWVYFENEEENSGKDCHITLKNCTNVEISPRDNEMPFSEDDCLDKLVYSEKKDIISFFFWGGVMIKCKCEVFRFEILE